MAEITLVAETGRPTGSRASGRLRAGGRVPGVVYGHGGDSVPVNVDWRDLRQALSTAAGLNALINLDIGGTSELTMVKELQRHPVRHSVLHVDFVRVRRDEAMTVEVPIELVGEAEDVSRADGLVEHVLRTLTITAKPADIPTELTVDISGLQVGDTVRVADLRLPAGVTTEVDDDEPVVTARIAAALEVPEEAPEAEEAEEGAEAAEGEGAPAAESQGGE
ncbi:MAG: 50S ribosomal protein L25 [Acidimicrobiales bacterium]